MIADALLWLSRLFATTALVWWLVAWLVLALLSRLSENRTGIKFDLKAAPFTHEWELFNILPRWTANRWDTGNDGERIIRFYRARSIYGYILCFRYSLAGALLDFEMTREESEQLQRIATVIEYDKDGEPNVTQAGDPVRHAALTSEYTKRGRRVPRL